MFFVIIFCFKRPCTVIYEYKAQEADELNLHVGHPVLVKEISDDGWARGTDTQTGLNGWFHGSFVQPDAEAIYVLATRTFAAKEANGSLPFSEKEKLRVLVKSSDHWWLAMRTNGSYEAGFVPASFVKKMPRPAPRQPSHKGPTAKARVSMPFSFLLP